MTRRHIMDDSTAAGWTSRHLFLFLVPMMSRALLVVPSAVIPRRGSLWGRHTTTTNTALFASSDDQDRTRQPKRSSSADLYSSAELANLLHLHTNLVNTTFSSAASSPSDTAPLPSSTVDEVMSLHDLVMLETGTQVVTAPTSQSFQSRTASSATTASTLSHARMIASDVDGTLLTSQHTMHHRTRQALYRVLDAVSNPHHPLQYFCLATGKTRAGALASIRNVDPILGDRLSQTPGVFIQGLYCVDANGQPLWEQRLDREPVLAVERIAAREWKCYDSNITIFAYRRDEIFASDMSQHAHHIQELHERWGEPLAHVIDGLDQLKHDLGPGFVNKLLVMDHNVEHLSRNIRPALEALADRYGCVVTQAIPTMLEFLPPGCSKAEGVRRLCRALQLDANQLVAIGDAENDVGMIDMAAVGFVVGNAVPAARKVADVVLDETNDQGGAGAAIERVLEEMEV